MAINRRQFIKRSAGAVSVSLIMPRFWMGGVAQGQEIAADPNRKIFVVIQLAGGNDGLNTIIPANNDVYLKSRPSLGIKTRTHRLDDSLALNPGMDAFKSLFDEGQLAIDH